MKPETFDRDTPFTMATPTLLVGYRPDGGRIVLAVEPCRECGVPNVYGEITWDDGRTVPFVPAPRRHWTLRYAFDCAEAYMRAPELGAKP